MVLPRFKIKRQPEGGKVEAASVERNAGGAAHGRCSRDRASPPTQEALHLEGIISLGATENWPVR